METQSVNPEPTEAEILHPSAELFVTWKGKKLPVKRVSMRDALDLMQDMMGMVANVSKEYPDANIMEMKSDKMALVMMTQMEQMFKVPARLIGLTEEEFLDGYANETSEAFKVIMSSADVMKVFENLSEGWGKMNLQTPVQTVVTQNQPS